MKNWNKQLIVLLAISLTACAGLRRAETGVEQAVDNRTTIPFEWGEVYCGEGTVCSEIEVTRVDVEQRNGGTVSVMFHNRTGYQAAFQVSLEIVDANGVRLDGTNYEDFGLQPRNDRRYEMPGIYKEGAKVRVLLRGRKDRATIK